MSTRAKTQQEWVNSLRELDKQLTRIGELLPEEQRNAHNDNSFNAYNSNNNSHDSESIERKQYIAQVQKLLDNIRHDRVRRTRLHNMWELTHQLYFLKYTAEHQDSC